MTIIDWNQMSELGLIERINREILHPIGLAVSRDVETGHSTKILVADDGFWEIGVKMEHKPHCAIYDPVPDECDCGGCAATTQQKAPVATLSRPIVDMVVCDLVQRKMFGIEKYGKPLQAGNGRDALVDAYQEALDLAIYLKQAIEERDNAK